MANRMLVRLKRRGNRSRSAIDDEGHAPLPLNSPTNILLFVLHVSFHGGLLLTTRLVITELSENLA